MLHEVAIDHDQIGRLTGFECTQPIRDAEELGVAQRPRSDGFEG